MKIRTRARIQASFRAARCVAARFWLVALLLGVGCASEDPTSAAVMTAPQPYGGVHLGGTATGDTQEGVAFARWVLEQDPQRRYLTDAVVRGDHNLGVKVQPTATKADLERLLTALAQGMAQTFPGRPLTVVAFYQSGDKLAQASYDPRSGQVALQFAR